MDAFIVALPTILKAMAMGAVPILLTALGELFCERAGLVNIGLEGLVAAGAFAGFAVAKLSASLWLGFAAAMAAAFLTLCYTPIYTDGIVMGRARDVLQDDPLPVHDAGAGVCGVAQRRPQGKRQALPARAALGAGRVARPARYRLPNCERRVFLAHGVKNLQI